MITVPFLCRRSLGLHSYPSNDLHRGKKKQEKGCSRDGSSGGGGGGSGGGGSTIRNNRFRIATTNVIIILIQNIFETNCYCAMNCKCRAGLNTKSALLGQKASALRQKCPKKIDSAKTSAVTTITQPKRLCRKCRLGHCRKTGTFTPNVCDCDVINRCFNADCILMVQFTPSDQCDQSAVSQSQQGSVHTDLLVISLALLFHAFFFCGGGGGWWKASLRA